MAGRPFDPNDPTTWDQSEFGRGDGAAQTTRMGAERAAMNYGQNPNMIPGANKFGTTTGLNSSNRGTLNDWANDTDGAKSWLSRGESAADTRNNFSYGGYAGGADDFNNRLGFQREEVAGNFQGLQNNALAGQAGANAAMGAAQGMAGNAYQRDPGAFIDETAVGNNALDRNRQLSSYNALMGFANNGPGPSAAQAQLNMATDANMANSLAMARSGRGMGGSQAMLGQAMTQNAAIGQQAGNQSAMLRAQEDQAFKQQQLAAYGQAGGLAGQVREGDVAAGNYTTGARTAGRAQADQAALGFSNLGLGYGGLGAQYGNQAQGAIEGKAGAYNQFGQLENAVNSGALQGNMNYEGNILDKYQGQHAGDAAANEAGRSRTERYVGAGVKAGATALVAASDVSMKKDIVPIGNRVGAAMGAGAQRLGGGDDGDLMASLDALAAKYGVKTATKPADVKKYSESDDVAQGGMWVKPKGVDTSALDAASRRDGVEPSAAKGDALLAQSARNTPPSLYNYKDPGAPGASAEPQVGPMAQDLAADPLAKQAVVKMPNGKLGLDPGRMGTLTLAQNHSQQNQLDDLYAMLDESKRRELANAAGGLDQIGNRY